MSAEAKPHPQQNHLLAELSQEVQGRLFPHLEIDQQPFRCLLLSMDRLSHSHLTTAQSSRPIASLRQGNNGTRKGFRL